ncbi:hypothetical protein [Cupriavidus agavae]|uniref:Tetratricopeptide repeat protein n=1 Tax=Cupriavidus agavae TaxID=1001822 RepID=A0A4Q7RAP5_9BURK|nr:hypothetical protein [Cupriavidus agavae]RZT29258.1 hypothetical protein EV147_4888 [Cupriavidus agavae]
MNPQYSATQASPAPDDASLPLWERTMRAAVSRQRAGQWKPAADGYRQALDIALLLMDRAPAARADDCVAALVVSFLNLSDAQAELGHAEQAVALLCNAHETLLALHLEPCRLPELRAAALRHTRETHMAIVMHARDHGMHPLCARALDAGRQALEPQRAQPH